MKKQSFRIFKKNKFSDSEKGFSLLELLTTITIIGLITTIILNSLTNARAKGQDSALIASAQQLTKAFELFLSDHGRYPYDGMNTNNCQLGGGSVTGAYCIFRPITPAYETLANTANINAIITSLGPYAARLPEILTGANGITRTMNVFIFDNNFTPNLCFKDLEGTTVYIPQPQSYMISGRLNSPLHNPFTQTTGAFPYTGGNVPRGAPPFTYGGVTCS